MFVLLAAFLAANGAAMAGSALPDASSITAPPPAPPPRPGPARGLAPVVGLFSTDDYPVAALRRDEEGLVAVDVEVTPGGQVGACRVTQSSSSATLDAATCAIITRRARYRPARDESGVAVTGSDKVRIKWVLPRWAYRANDDSIYLHYAADGSLASCEFKPDTIDNPSCVKLELMADHIRTGLGLTTWAGKTLMFIHSVNAGGPVAPPALISGRLTELWSQTAEYRLRPDGRLSECQLIGGDATGQPANLCVDPVDGPFEQDGSNAYRPLRTTLVLVEKR